MTTEVPGGYPEDVSDRVPVVLPKDIPKQLTEYPVPDFTGFLVLRHPHDEANASVSYFSGTRGTLALSNSEISPRSLFKEHNGRGNVSPIRLSFDDVEDRKVVIGKEVADADLKRPFKEAVKTLLTRRIIEFTGPEFKLPVNIKLYDGTTDPEDHLNRFSFAANSGEWSIPVWCLMFQQTLDGNARRWFENLLGGSIDGWVELRQQFTTRFSTRRACFKDPTEITKIMRKANEILVAFKER
ncbi:hypothetical protein Tco_0941776 [Tanacetum coccineum]|uniref:Reverse transcriptase domain-containing protein n=1 Tax=Tanacetum coccineum TaxID=301880 RepID=A0ABQ5DUE8_9ASTR